MASATGATITLLLTDLVGSTALGSRLGDEAAQALRRAHDRILIGEFRRFGGRVVKGMGDGFMVAFDSASRAVQCAIAIQRAITTQHAEGRYSELQVRVGLHTGEPLSEGDDLFGNDVNLAARIVSEAEGGQIVASHVTYLLSRGDPQIQFGVLGERSLKGFDAPVPLFMIHWAEVGVTRPHLTRFIGRRDELRQVRERLRMAVQGEGGLVLVVGEAGVGKTRLISELAIEAVDRGLHVLRGGAYEIEGKAPYLPFVEALREHVRNRSADDLREELGDTVPYIGRLLPELQLLVPLDSSVPMASPEAERHRLFEAISDAFIRMASRTPLLLFLDDLHWADDATLLLLQHVSLRLAAAPLLIVGAYRDVEVDTRHPLLGLVGEMARQRRLYSVSLRPFNEEEAAALVEAAIGRPPARRVAAALYSAAAGNPFFTEELISHLSDQGHDLADPGCILEDWAIPLSVKQVIARRLSRLGTEASRMLSYASVLARDLSLAKVAAITQKDEGSLLELMDEALLAHILREEGDAYVFTHPLIQQTLYEELGAARRRHLHRRVAQVLEELHRADPEPHLAELAYHFTQAGEQGDVDKAISYAARAAERAMGLFAYEEAARLYETGLQALNLKTPPDDRTRSQLLLSLGEAQNRAGDFDRAKETFQQAAEIARRLGDPERLARAALGFSAGFLVNGVADETAVAPLEEASQAIGGEDSVLQAQLLARLAAALYYSQSKDRRAALCQQAVEMARRVGDATTLAYVLGTTRFALRGPENVRERLEVAIETVRLAETTGEKELALRGHAFCLVDLLELGDIDAVDREIDAVAALAEELRQAQYFWSAAVYRAMRGILAGRWEEGERLAQEALSVGQRAGDPAATITFGIQMIALRREQGRLAELEPAVRSFVEGYPAVRWLIALAYVHSQLGRGDEARAEFDLLSASDFVDLPQDVNWLIGVTLLSEVCSFLGDPRRAAQLYPLLLPYAERNILAGNGSACDGSASRHLGLLAATMARWSEAAQHFEDAIAMNSRIQSLPLVAHTKYHYAAMLSARQQAGDEARAAQLIDEAIHTYRTLAMPAGLQKAERLRATLA